MTKQEYKKLKLEELEKDEKIKELKNLLFKINYSKISSLSNILLAIDEVERLRGNKSLDVIFTRNFFCDPNKNGEFNWKFLKKNAKQTTIKDQDIETINYLIGVLSL